MYIYISKKREIVEECSTQKERLKTKNQKVKFKRTRMNRVIRRVYRVITNKSLPWNDANRIYSI